MAAGGASHSSSSHRYVTVRPELKARDPENAIDPELMEAVFCSLFFLSGVGLYLGLT